MTLAVSSRAYFLSEKAVLRHSPCMAASELPQLSKMRPYLSRISSVMTSSRRFEPYVEYISSISFLILLAVNPRWPEPRLTPSGSRDMAASHIESTSDFSRSQSTATGWRIDRANVSRSRSSPASLGLLSYAFSFSSPFSSFMPSVFFACAARIARMSRCRSNSGVTRSLSYLPAANRFRRTWKSKGGPVGNSMLFDLNAIPLSDRSSDSPVSLFSSTS
mmetsp:Transcript_13083/g.30990  ORF Transcript_13083/g.30990 Transcript_13083/m.30990 type:complete len:219 (-) Transcript_13083:1261-1917(-)